ncbi:N-formylglutamate deformylase [Sphingomonas sp. PB4P5]|uniref:N-formylglutamate deformylase n=1 Tax=Parasphingomonas puruogangriensis TaxID=3096155 RepID=UPI002FCC5861
MSTDWLTVRRGQAPLVIAVPHAGTDLPGALATRFVSPWLARKDADWWIDDLYAFAADALDATIVATGISRSVIDVNRDPSGASLYPGQATTDLCPVTTFDGDPLYKNDAEPGTAEIAERRVTWFDPYHAQLAAEIARLRESNDRVVVYDAHSIRSHVPRLFDGELPLFNIGTNSNATCAPELGATIEQLCAGSGYSHVRDGRFKGGWTTRHYGQPHTGVHAVQMELAMRGYLDEPAMVDPAAWPRPLDPRRAAPVQAVLRQILQACLTFARTPA